jgi:methionyl-tRNA formyltransferase
MVEALAALEQGRLACRPQSEDGVTYARKVDPAETRIDWSRPAVEVHNLIRGLSPYPGAWFEIELSGKRERVKALRSALAEGSGPPATLLDASLTIACGKGSIRLTELQRAGKRPLPAAEFRKGAELPVGTVLD